MSTENNLNVLFDNSVKILTDLIAFKTISGEDNNSLIDYCDNILKKLGATSFRTFDEDKKRVNLFATIKSKFFFLIFIFALLIILSVSAQKPIKI